MIRVVDGLFDVWLEGGCAAPLAVTGVRGCGKTHSVADFLERNGLEALTLDYRRDDLRGLLAGTDDRRARSALSAMAKGTLSEGDFIVVDGIRTRGEASSSAAMLTALSKTYRVIAICSLHGAFGDGFEEIRMGPMSFIEYLEAFNHEALADSLRSGAPCSDEAAASLFSEFCLVGGLPGAVKAWWETRSESDVDRAIRDVLLMIHNDAVELQCGGTMNSIMESLPEQLAQDNKKFVFSRAVPNARSKGMRGALDELAGMGALRMVPIREEGRPDGSAFKAYCFDTGALRVLYGLPMDATLKSGGGHGFASGLTENAALLELEKSGFSGIWCWRSGNRAEVEFVVRSKDGDTPVQVDPDNRFYVRSLREYAGRRSPSALVHLCPRPEGEREGVLELPLHAACTLPAILGLPSDK